jgi:thymidylate synthase ThyX
MSSTVSISLIKALHDEVISFAKEIQENVLENTSKNLKQIQEEFEGKFTDDLVLGGLPKATAKRIAKTTAETAMFNVMAETIQA